MILITGGAGVVGRKLSKGLIERGFEIRVLDRPGTSIDGVDVDLRHGDITDPASLDDALFEGVDTVYHLAAVILPVDRRLWQAVNVDGTRNMVEASIRAGVKHFVSVSSASVVYPHVTEYSLSKRAAEAIVRGQDKMAWTIVRPTLVYDENGGEEFFRYLDYLRRFPIVPFIGRGRALKKPVHTEDILRGMAAIAGNPRTYGKTYALTGADEISIWDLSRLMMKHHRCERPMLPIPVPFWRVLAWILARVQRDPPLTWQMIAGITQDANLSHAEAAADLDYRPMGVREGFQKTWPL